MYVPMQDVHYIDDGQPLAINVPAHCSFCNVVSIIFCCCQSCQHPAFVEGLVELNEWAEFTRYSGVHLIGLLLIKLSGCCYLVTTCVQGCNDKVATTWKSD